MLQQQVSENKLLMQQMMQQQTQMTSMMQMMMHALTSRQSNGIDIIPPTAQPIQSHVPASPAIAANSVNMPPPSVRTPGPKSNHVDLSAQLTIVEAMKKAQANTPSKQHNTHAPQQTTPRTPSQSHNTTETTGMDVTMSTAQAPKPTPSSARKLSQLLHKSPSLHVSKRHRPSDSPHHS